MPHVYTIDGARVALPTIAQPIEPVDEGASVTRRLWIAVGVLAVAVAVALPLSLYSTLRSR